MEDKKWCVYKHTNTENGKVYIGITGDDPESRWAKGLRYQANAHFTSAIKKYGWDGFNHEVVIDDLTCEEASRKERELIAYYNSANREYGYNIALGGFGRDSVSDETREKMRQSHLGARNHNYGKPKTEEQRRKTSESNKRYWAEHPRPKGFKRPPEFSQKLSASLKGRKCPCEGKKRDRATIEKLIKANSKAVLCIETGAVYPSAKVAEIETGVNRATISNVCNKKRNRELAGGYHWRFATEEDAANNVIKNVAPSTPSRYKKIRCVETGVVYCSIAEAARQVGRAKNTVHDACKNSAKTAGGYHWQYVTEGDDVELAVDSAPVVVLDNPSNYKAVRCVETGDVYPSMADAARWANTSRQEVLRACKKSTKLAGGFHWESV